MLRHVDGYATRGLVIVGLLHFLRFELHNMTGQCET